MEAKIEWAVVEDSDDDVFVLGEPPPPPPPKPRVFHIRVEYDGVGTYIARWGKKRHYEARSMATALRILADDFERTGEHGSTAEKFDAYRRDTDVFCKYCNAPIFFAVLPSMKYLAFDVEPLQAKDVRGERCATFPTNILIGRREKPMVTWSPRAHGPVFVPHPQVCGTLKDAPLNEHLEKRWEENRSISLERRSKIVTRLQAIKSDIEQGALHDPNA